MIDDPFTPEEQELIQRLRAAYRPSLRPSTREAIRQHVVTEFRASAGVARQPRLPHAHRSRLVVRFAAASVALASVVAIGLVILRIGNQPTGNGTIANMTASSNTQVAIAPSETLQSPPASVTPGISATPTPSRTAEIGPEISATTILPTEMMILTTPTPTPAPGSETVVVVEGPITNVTDNVITVYDFSVEVPPEHPILKLIDVGDLVRVEGALGTDDAILASVVSNIYSTTVVDSSIEATVNLEGPVEAIAGNLVTINGIQVQLDPANPVLRTLQVGNFVSVQGDFQGSGTTIVLMVVSFTVINNVTIIENDCWYHDTGMGMGHWHCDGMGMGMGMGAMGMEAMGMGE